MNVHAFMHEGEIHNTELYILFYIHTHTHTHFYNQMFVAYFHVMLDLIENPRFEGRYNGDKTNKICYSHSVGRLVPVCTCWLHSNKMKREQWQQCTIMDT